MGVSSRFFTATHCNSAIQIDILSRIRSESFFGARIGLNLKLAKLSVYAAILFKFTCLQGLSVKVHKPVSVGVDQAKTQPTQEVVLSTQEFLPAHKKAILVLADGSVFRGTAIGAEGLSVGEVVFNTSITGYQEIITDPSYAQQIVTLTYPHIGNTGANSEDEECERIWASGLVIRDLPLVASNFRSQSDLSSYLKARNIIGIADVDTRRLTRLLRETGSQNGCIMAGDIDEAEALRAAKALDRKSVV